MEHDVELVVLEETEYHMVLAQDPEQYADYWEFRAKWDGCINFMQHDPGDPDGEPVHYTHACSAKHLIALLEHVRLRCRKKWGEDWDA